MKNKLLKILPIALILLFMVLVTLASCNPQDQGKLVLHLGGVGNDIVVDDLSKLPSISDTEDWHFGGWYEDETLQTEATLPTELSKGTLDLYAKWYRTYTVFAALETLDGDQASGVYEVDETYTRSYEYVKSDSDEVEAEALVIPGFELATSSRTLKVSSKDGASIQLNYDRKTFEVTFRSGQGSRTLQMVYGAPLPEAFEFVQGDDRHRFAGWRSGDQAGAPGSPMLVEGGVYTAEFDEAKTDVFGGEDLLFAASLEEGAVYLHRDGMPEKKGALKEDGSFGFTLDSGEVVGGRVKDEWFYYFKDSVEKRYASYENSNSYIEFLPDGKAVYVNAAGESKDGVYDLQLEYGTYVFISDDGQTSFAFDIETVDENLYFIAAKEDEVGMFGAVAADGDWVVIVLNGVGGASMYNAENSLDGYYEYDEDSSSFTLYMVVGETEDGDEQYSTYRVRLKREDAGSIGGYQLDGSFIVSDGMAGKYYAHMEDLLQADKTNPDVLIVDGFGGGTFKGKAINYTISVYTLTVQEAYGEDSYVDEEHYRVDFDLDGEHYMLALDNSWSSPDSEFYVPMIGEPELVQFAASSQLQYIYGDEYEDMYGAFLYLYGKGETFVYVYSYYQGSLSGLYVFEQVDYGYISYDESKDLYHFETKDDYFGVTGENFSFMYDENDLVITQTYAEEQTVIEDILWLDIFGYAHYVRSDGRQMEVTYTVDYSSELFGFNLITFRVNDPVRYANGMLHVWVTFDEDENTDEHNNKKEKMYFEPIEQPAADGEEPVSRTALMSDTNAYGMIFFVVYGEGEEGDVAYVAYAMGSDTTDSYYYFLKGNWTEDGNIATFQVNEEDIETYTEYLASQKTPELKMYFNCTVKVNGDGNCAIYDNVVHLDTENGILDLDGYGKATLQSDNGLRFSNANYAIVDDIVQVETIEGGVTIFRYIHLIRDEEDKIVDFKIAGDESGEYYMFGSDGYIISEGGYFIFLGYGVVIYNSSSWGSLYGEYESTGNKVSFGEDVFDEYELTFMYDETTVLMQQTIAVLHRTLSNGREQVLAGEFIGRDSIYQNFDVEGGGRIISDGYHTSVYEAADGNSFKGYAQYVAVSDKDYNSSSGPVADTAGERKNVLFGIYDEDENIVRSLLFDVLDNGKLSLRDNCYGTYQEVENNVASANYMYLDGHGNATLYDGGGNEIGKGTYRLSPEIDSHAIKFIPNEDEGEDVEAFVFGLFSATVSEDEYHQLYIKYNGNDGVYVSEDWEILKLDSYGQGVMIDKYGVSVVGGYSVVLENESGMLINFKDNDEVIPHYFTLDKAKSAFSSPKDGYIAFDGLLLYYQGDDVDIVLPDTILTVADEAFDKKSLRSVDFNKVTSIGDFMFENMTSLVSVKGENVTFVGNFAFDGCINLQTVDMPNIEQIGRRGFALCTNLTSIKLDKVSEIGPYAFAREAGGDKLRIDMTAHAAPASVMVGDYAFVPVVDGSPMLSGCIDVKIVLKDIQTVNTMMKSEWSSEVKPKMGIALENDDMNGISYVSFQNTAAYYFEEGSLIKKVTLQDVSTVALYMPEENGVRLYYKQADETYVDSGVVLEALPQITLDNSLAFRTSRSASANPVIHTFDVGSVQIRLQIVIATYGNSYAGVTLNAWYDGSAAASAQIKSGSGVVRLTMSDGSIFDISEFEESACKLDVIGMNRIMDSDDGVYRLQVSIKDNKIAEVLNFQECERPDAPESEKTWTTRAIVSSKVDAEGACTVEVSIYSDENAEYVVSYDVEGGSLEVRLNRWKFFVDERMMKDDASYYADCSNCEVKAEDIYEVYDTTSNWAYADQLAVISVVRTNYTLETIENDCMRGTNVFTVTTAQGTYTMTIVVTQNPSKTSYSASVTVTKDA